MKYYKRITAIFLSVVSMLLCACGGTVTAEPTPEPTAEPLAFSDDPVAITEASANIVMLTTYDKNGEVYKTGSGFPAFEDGYIVTNYHVIEGADRIEGNTESEIYFKIDEITAADKERDIAILKTNAKTGLTPLTLGDTSVLQKGEKVVAIGSPLGLINTVSDGIYSNRRTEDGQEYLQFTAAISPGSSGGALFNDKGEVIGITSASYTEGQNLNLAIPSEVVQDVWEDKALYAESEQEIKTHNEFDDKQYLAINEYYEIKDTLNEEEYLLGAFVSSIYRFNWNGMRQYNIYLVNSVDEVLGEDYSASLNSKEKEGSNEYSEIEKMMNGEAVEYIVSYNEPDSYIEPFKPGNFVVIKYTWDVKHECYKGVPISINGESYSRN